MIVVTDGDGDFGRAVVAHLLTRLPASDVAVTAQDPRAAADLAGLGVEVRYEDFSDPSALFAGADRVLSNAPPGWHRGQLAQDGVGRAEERIAAAVAAGVSHLVHVGIINVAMTHLLWHHALEGQVRDSGIPFTILRNNLHTEALLPAARLALATGELVCDFGGQSAAPAARTDYAEVAATVLTADGHVSEVYELSGNGLTAMGIASVLSMVGDREITLREVAAADLAAELTRAGATDDDVATLTDLYAAVGLAEFAPETETLDKLLGRPHLLNADALRRALAG